MACVCTGSPLHCEETAILGFQAATTTSTSTGELTVILETTMSGETSCTLAIGGGAPSPVTCGLASLSVPTPTATTTYTLSVSGGGGGTATAQTTVSCGATSNPNVDGGACSTGATVYCEGGALSVTSSQQAEDACNACNGGGCTDDANEALLGGASGWRAPEVDGGAGALWYVYAAGTSPATTPVPCVNPYTVAPGDIIQSGGACGHVSW